MVYKFLLVAAAAKPRLKRAHLVVALGVALIGLLSVAVAGGGGDVTTALGPIGTFFCSVATFARNNIAYAVLAAALIIGALLKGGGSQLGVRVMQGSLVGGLVVLIAPPLIALFVASTTCTLT